VYTTPTCTYCNSLKSYLKKMQVNFREVDVSKSPEQAQQLVTRTGQQGVPQTEINGKFVVGFDTNKLNKLLELQ
ncbi:MAG: glutaredoxin family protein, partial [Bacteroidales bacterium]